MILFIILLFQFEYKKSNKTKIVHSVPANSRAILSTIIDNIVCELVHCTRNNTNLSPTS